MELISKQEENKNSHFWQRSLSQIHSLPSMHCVEAYKGSFLILAQVQYLVLI